MTSGRLLGLDCTFVRAPGRPKNFVQLLRLCDSLSDRVSHKCMHMRWCWAVITPIKYSMQAALYTWSASFQHVAWIILESFFDSDLQNHLNNENTGQAQGQVILLYGSFDVNTQPLLPVSYCINFSISGEMEWPSELQHPYQMACRLRSQFSYGRITSVAQAPCQMCEVCGTCIVRCILSQRSSNLGGTANLQCACLTCVYKHPGKVERKHSLDVNRPDWETLR